jgi:ferredoxin
MNWDYADVLWNARRAATTIFGLSCGVEDDSCFCSAVFLEPAASRGSDGRLTPVEGGYLVETFTDKGEAFVAGHDALFTELAAGADGAALDAQAEGFRAAARERVAANLQVDHGRLRDWLDHHFDDPFWASLGPRCNGCGVCASVCPTCHCFDIVDEPESVGRGVRRRNWDTCQTCVFTLHASGHNPRQDQNARFRQRVEHKFLIYPLKFGDVLCTGCGRCSRACPTGQDLAEILADIDALAAAGEAAS